ncbi:MAG: hypothetical protein ABSH09_31145 [Bryobacteraceae bacterium]|jgi:hypothetical protein
MNSFIRTHKKLAAVTVLAFLFAGFFGWDSTARTRGKIQAHLDVSRGHYAILIYGLQAESLPETARLMRQRYGIELRVVADCIVTKPLVAYVDGYNMVSMPAVRRKFGRDVFEQTMLDASKTWRTRTRQR